MTTSQADRTTSRRVMRDGVLVNLAGLASSALSLLLVPLFLHELGAAMYGVWLAATSIAAIVIALDLGLGMAILREVANTEPSSDTAAVLATARWLYGALAAAAALALFTAGLVMQSSFRLAPEQIADVPWVFGLTAIGLFADVLNGYPIAILGGRRRYATLSALAFIGAAVRAIGFVVALRLWPHDVRHVVAWQALVSMVLALVGFGLAARADVRAWSRARPSWQALLSRSRFALSSQLAAAAGVAMWRGPTLLIGLVLGSSPLAAFSIAQRFPLALQTVLWRLADPLLPAVREQSDRGGVANLFVSGTRWTLWFALPGALTLALVGSSIIDAWVGTDSTSLASVLAITTAAVLAEGISHAAEQVLWGVGLARDAVRVALVRAIVILVLALAAIPRFELVGCALVILIGVLAGTVMAVRAACGYCRISMAGVLGRAAAGALLPALVCGGATWGVLQLAPLHGWQLVIAASSASTLGLAACAAIQRPWAHGY